MKQKSRVGETRLSLPKSISPSSDSLSTATHVAIKYTDDFIPNLSRIPHESIPSLSPTSFAADFNLKENTSALLSPNCLSLLFANKKTFQFSIISYVLLPMDPRNPYSQNSGYVGLLHNVQNNNVQENFPPSSVDIGASEMPLFSSQQSEATSQPQDTPVERMVRRKWTSGDDEFLDLVPPHVSFV
ncbi:hypothetical protein F2Q70_00039433 [Brassica cretica]|uniref:Uncharacterized protein n=1 Tax=Brassica cretica TaxID=69181 RepID=A0A8S9K566_BRACR|nr:hypothetical protein F2Q70_00039433 [Brassica cretica]